MQKSETNWKAIDAMEDSKVGCISLRHTPAKSRSGVWRCAYTPCLPVV